jgi:hypothetical protein
MPKAEKPISRLLDFVYKVTLASILIFIPLYPKFPLFSVPFTYVAIRAEDFLILFASFLWALIVIRDRHTIRFPRITLSIAVFIIIGLFSSISAIFLTQNVQPLLVVLHYLRRIQYIIVFFLFYHGSLLLPNRQFLFKVFHIPAFFVFAYGIAQLYFGAPVISTMDSEASKGLALFLRPGVTLSSTFSGHYDLAVYLCMIIILFFSHIVTLTRRWPLIISYIGMLPMAWLFMQTGSRISLASLYLAIGALTLISKKHLQGFVTLSILTVFLLTSPQFAGRFDSLLDVVKIKLQSTVKISHIYASAPEPTPTLKVLPTPTPEPLRAIQSDRSTSIRFDVEWPRAIRAFYKNPLFGTGYSSITLATDNSYLRLLGEVGLLGLTSFMAILAILLKTIWHKLQQTRPSALHLWSIGVLICFLTTATFLDVFEASKIAILFWAVMGLSFAAKS